MTSFLPFFIIFISRLMPFIFRFTFFATLFHFHAAIA
jgi:hypothetical protein